MIARLTGRILECRPDHALLDVAGVGYLVHVPLSTYYALCHAPRGAEATLHVHTHVREDALQLYGFSTEAERSAFERLISISGVGPRLGLAFLSGIGVEELRECVLARDLARLQKIPGVGRKTAERVLLELQDKFAPAGRGEPVSATPASGAVPAPVAGNADLRRDAVSALVNLGYATTGARRAVDVCLAEQAGEATLESVLRGALGRLSG